MSAPRALRVVSFAAPLRKYGDEAAARASLRELGVVDYTLAQVELGKTPAPFWLATLTMETKRKFDDRGSVVVHVGAGWSARLAWTAARCIRCEVP